MRFASTVVVSFTVTALTYVAMQLWIGPRLPVPSLESPSLSGMTVQQARTAMDARGLRLILDEERAKDGVTPGTICEQRPLSGSMLRRGDEIHVVIAKSGDATRVPRTAGMTPQAAREIIEAQKLRVGDVTQVADATTPAGLVIGTAPPAEASAALGATVTLHVSTGANMAAVPQLFGKRLSSAKEAIEKAGFQLGAVKKGSNEDRDPGEVIAQTPKAAEQAAAGSKIDLVINSD